MTGLSCYTANLAAYLAEEPIEVRAHVAGSIRLAVRTDTRRPEFSHHQPSLALLPDGSRLGYRSSRDGELTMAALERELSAYGRVLVVGTGSHWVLLDDRHAERWHVVDRFAALLPQGEKHPFTGWVDTAGLLAALCRPAQPTRAQWLRDAYAFGDRVTPPPHTHLRWLARGSADDGQFPGTWATDDAALRHLARWFTACDDAVANYEDVWAAARHQEYRLRWLASCGALPESEMEHAVQVWWQLATSLRFAVESLARGRPRPSVVEHAFEVAVTGLASVPAVQEVST